MTLRLTIENQDRLPDGGPMQVEVSGRGLDFGRDQHLDWTLPDPSRYVSGKHGEVRFRDGGYWLTDVSTNGTFLNGADFRMQSPYRLRDGDRLAIGHYIVRVDIPAEAGTGASAAAGAAAGPAGWGGADLWGSPQPAAPPVERAALVPPRPAAPPPPDFLDWAANLDPLPPAFPGLDPPTLSGPWPEPEPLPGAAAPFPSAPSVPPPGDDIWGAPPVRPEPPITTPAPGWEAPPVGWGLPEPGAADAPAPPAAEAGDLAGAAIPTPRRPAEPPTASPPAVAPPPASPAPASPEPAAPPAVTAPPPRSVPPEPPRPEPPPVAARPQLAGGEGEAALLARIAVAAGLAPDAFARRDAGAVADEIGALLRLSTEELRQMLAARAETKSLVRSSSRTMVQAFDNNPLKFSPTAEDALKIMFGPRSRSYLDAAASVREGFADLKAHQIQTYAAMQGAIEALFEDLAPEKIDAGVEQERGFGGLVGSRKARLWDTYAERWKAKAGRHDGRLVDAFMLLFAECYDRLQRRER